MSGDHTTVEVRTLPGCDFCALPAAYDGKTVSGPWAYMCIAHFAVHGVGTGLGFGQRLLLRPVS